MATPPSHVQALLPDTSCLKLKSVEHQDSGRVLITAAAFSSAAYCPACQCVSHSLHSRYSRVLRDLPWQGSTVVLRLDVRRFRCRVRDCSRVTFTEALPLVSPKYGRQTSRLSETIRLIGYVLGGEAGARLAERLGMGTSPDTVLRRLKLGPSVPVQGVKAVGVDDWAWRKGQRYETILVDLETHAPIDLLPDRSAESLAAWLQSHPGAEVISRDRGGIYADGATRGAPQAIQVADRFHLLCNLTSAVERVLEQKRPELAKAIVAVIPEPPPPEPDPLQADSPPKAKTRSAQEREDRRQRRVDRYNEVVGLYRKGMSQQEISRTLHLERKTIRRFLRAGQFPERATPHRRPPSVNKFQEFLQRRWAEGCHNATELWHEIQAQGYSGGRSTMARFVATLRTQGTKYFRKTVGPRQPKAKSPSPRQAAMLLSRRPEKLKPDEQQLLAKLNECCPEIPILYELAQDFAAVFRGKKSEALQTWIDDARRTGLPEIGRFCDGLLRDAAAVTAAVLLPWSNGQVEGQINRLKLVKREMYGRAKFDLLRRRVLPYVPDVVNPSPLRSP
jgi:transposase